MVTFVLCRVEDPEAGHQHPVAELVRDRVPELDVVAVVDDGRDQEDVEAATDAVLDE